MQNFRANGSAVAEKNGHRHTHIEKYNGMYQNSRIGIAALLIITLFYFFSLMIENDAGK